MTTRSTERLLLVLGLFAVGAATPAVSGQRVNDDYSVNNASGLYRVVQNVSNFKTIVGGNPAAARRRIPMADPTIMKLGEYYYVTGTSDATNTANFTIYRSANLVDWWPHMVAFRDADDLNFASSYTKMLEGPFPGNGYTITHPLINNRRFSDMWAPHLYFDSATQTVWLSFTVVEHKNNGCGVWTYDMRSVRCASITKASFEAGGPSNNFATGNTAEPLAYQYLLNNSGPAKLDGGYAQGHAIPVTGDPSQYFPCHNPPLNGEAFKDGNDYSIGLMGSAAFMNLDSFVYRDTDSTLWMMYTWRADQATDTGSNGNHVAAYPMLNHQTMNAYGSILPIAYRFHYWFWPQTTQTCSPPAPAPVPPTGWLLNGASDYFAQRFGGCGSNKSVAEAPAAFNRNGNTYVLYSRNTWDSSAYGIFYRVGQGASFSQMYLRDDNGNLSWSDIDYGEGPIVWSQNRGVVGGRSYGHGEVFIGPTAANQPPRYFLIYHAKEQAGQHYYDANGQLHVPYPSGYSGRTVYFKELRFDGQGYITSFSDNSQSNATDADVFLIPY